MDRTDTPSLLSGLAQEIALMIPVVEGLSGLVLDHAVQAAGIDRPRILGQAQAVDDLVQRLQCLRRLTETVSGGASVESALGDVPLADMAARLKQVLAGGPASALPTDASCGDLLMFEQP